MVHFWGWFTCGCRLPRWNVTILHKDVREQNITLVTAILFCLMFTRWWSSHTVWVSDRKLLSTEVERVGIVRRIQCDAGIEHSTPVWPLVGMFPCGNRFVVEAMRILFPLQNPPFGSRFPNNIITVPFWKMNRTYEVFRMARMELLFYNMIKQCVTMLLRRIWLCLSTFHINSPAPRKKDSPRHLDISPPFTDLSICRFWMFNIVRLIVSLCSY